MTSARWRSAVAIVLAIPATTAAQSGFEAGSRTIFELDLSSAEPGQLPKQLRLLKGNLTLVQKDGKPMLRTTTPTEFLIELPEVLPADFTLEFGLVPKVCCLPQDLSFEGSRTVNQGIASAHILWDSHNSLSIIGGAQDNYEMPLAEELRTTLPGVPTQVNASFAGSTVKLYTNGRRMYTLEREFARGRVFRVFLGGSEGVEGAVHLASLRIASNMPAMRIAIAESDFVPGQRELYDLHTPIPIQEPGKPPIPHPSISVRKGAWTSVQKDGRTMRKVTKPTELVVSLLETLPRDFTVEIELVPKECCPPPDLTLEGTAIIDQGPRSAHLLWQADGAVAVIGGAENDNYEQPMPEDFKVIMPGAPTRIAVKFSGSTIKLYTNGRRLYTLTDRAFVRGKVLRVTLNAEGDGEQAEYLAGLRIATDAPPPKPRP
jgi:hypothetical protein